MHTRGRIRWRHTSALQRREVGDRRRLHGRSADRRFVGLAATRRASTFWPTLCQNIATAMTAGSLYILRPKAILFRFTSVDIGPAFPGIAVLVAIGSVGMDPHAQRLDAAAGATVLAANPYGYYDPGAREYVITRPDTPTPWINYLGQGRYGGIVSNTGGGFSFDRDPRDRRVSRYRYNSLPPDQPGRYIYLRRKGHRRVLGRDLATCASPPRQLRVPPRRGIYQDHDRAKGHPGRDLVLRASHATSGPLPCGAVGATPGQQLPGQPGDPGLQLRGAELQGRLQ